MAVAADHQQLRGFGLFHETTGGLVDDHLAPCRHVGVTLLPRAQLFGQFGVDRRAHLVEVETGHLEGAG